MGGDGGVIATRREFMRGTYNSHHKKKHLGFGANFGAGTTGGDAEQGVDPRRQRATKVRTCALSADSLEAPIVADELGNLFNKLAMLSALSERTVPERLEHIRGLRDLVDCRLTAVGDSDKDRAVTACPVTGAPLDGSKPFVVVRTTGWIVSQKAVEELGLTALQEEYGPFEADDLVRLAPDRDEAAELRRRMLARRARRKERRKHDGSGKKEAKKTKVAVVSRAAAIAQAAEATAERDLAKSRALTGVISGKASSESASSLQFGTARHYQQVLYG